MAKASVAFQRVCETFKIVELNAYWSATLQSIILAILLRKDDQFCCIVAEILLLYSSVVGGCL